MMNFQNAKNNSKRSIAAILILVLLLTLVGSLAAPKKPAKAAVATLPMQIVEYIMEIINWYEDYSSQTDQEDSLEEIEDVQDWFKDDTLDRRDERESWNEDRQDMLEDMVNDILDNMQDMGDGETAFVSEWNNFLDYFTQEAFQGFVNNELNQAQMCDTFQSEVQQEISGGNEPSYLAQVQCPSNYDSNALLAGTTNYAGDDFWSNWLKMLEPSGNPYGAYMISSDEKLETEGLAYTGRIFDLTANQGFRGTPDTPGIIQSYAVQRASMMDLDNLLNADELETYFSSVADAFINRIFNEGLAAVQTSGYIPTQPPPIYPPPVPPTEQAASYVESNIIYMANLRDRLGLVIDNLNNMIAQQNWSLSVLRDITNQQIYCGLSTANSTAEAATVTNERNQALTNIDLANQAIAGVDALMSIMNAVMAAQQSGDQAALTVATAAFIPAQANLISLVNSLTGGSANDINGMLSELSDFNGDVIRKTGTYYARRGTGQEEPGMDSYLYGWRGSLDAWCVD
jgi:hypothetical protein